MDDTGVGVLGLPRITLLLIAALVLVRPHGSAQYDHPRRQCGRLLGGQS